MPIQRKGKNKDYKEDPTDDLDPVESVYTFLEPKQKSESSARKAKVPAKGKSSIFCRNKFVTILDVKKDYVHEIQPTLVTTVQNLQTQLTIELNEIKTKYIDPMQELLNAEALRLNMEGLSAYHQGHNGRWDVLFGSLNFHEKIYRIPLEEMPIRTPTRQRQSMTPAVVSLSRKKTYRSRKKKSSSERETEDSQ